MLPEQQQRILGYFIEEAKDHLNTIEQGLLALQNTIDDREMLKEVYRAAHSIKGGAGMLGYSSIQKTAHLLEDCFKVLEGSPVRVDQKLEDLFLRVFDTLQSLVEQLQGPFGLPDDVATSLMATTAPVFNELQQHLEVLTKQSADGAKGATKASSGKEKEQLQVTFKQEVMEALRQMLQMFKPPLWPNSREDLVLRCFELQELGTQFDLPAWSRLLSCVGRAIANPDNSSQVLAPIAIKEIKQAQLLVLAGRGAEVEASEQLAALAPPPKTAEETIESDLVDLLALSVDSGEEDWLLQLEGVEASESDTTAAIPESDGNQELFGAIANETAHNAPAFLWENKNEPNPPKTTPRHNRPPGSKQIPESEKPNIAAPADPTGPEVGVAELNSLANLFPEELPELDSSWQVEEILSQDQNQPLFESFDDFMAEGDSELGNLFGETSTETDPENSLEDDTVTLFGKTFFDDEGNAEPVGSQHQGAVESELTDLFEEDFPASAKTTALETDEDLNLFGEDFFSDELASAPAAPQDEVETESELTDLFEEEFPASAETTASETDEDLNLFGEDFFFSDSTEEPARANLPPATPASEPEADDLSELFAGLKEDEFWQEELPKQSDNVSLARSEGDDLSSFGSGSWLEDWDSAAVAAPESNKLDLAGFAPSALDDWSVETLNVTSGQNELFTANEENLTATGAAPESQPELEALSPHGSFGEQLAFSFKSAEAEAASPLGEDSELIGLEAIDESWAAQTQQEAESFDFPDLTGDFEFDTSNLFGEEAATETPLAQSSSIEIKPTTDYPSFQNAEVSIDDFFSLDQPSQLWGEASQMQADSGLDAPDLFGDIDTDFPELSLAFDRDTGRPDAISNRDLEEFDLFAQEPAAGFDLFGTETETETEQDEVETLNVTSVQQSVASGEFELPENSPAEEELSFDLLSANSETGADDDDLGWLSEITEYDDAEAKVELAFADEESEAGGGLDLADLDEQFSFQQLDGEEANAPAETLHVTSLQLAGEDDFDDLEAMLGEEAAAAETPAAESEASFDLDFDDLEAMLGEGAIAPKSAAPTAATPRAFETKAASAASQAKVSDEFKDLEAMIASAENLGGPPMKPRPGQAATAKPRAARIFEQTMKVPVKQLDNLTNLVGELVVNRNSLEQDQERLRQFLDNLLHQVQQLSDVGARMQDLYERSLLESALLASRQSYRFSSSSGDLSNGYSTSSTWDHIEMDRFTPFHSLSQEMIELIVRVRESASDIEFIVDETDQVSRQFRQVTTQLQEGLTRARMVPFAEIERVFPLFRYVRDKAAEMGKQAELRIEGRETLIDKLILEHLSDPMKHLINNGLVHGIESPEVRQAAGKPPVGRITLSAFHQGNQTVISFSDDGAGIDVERLKAKAVEKRLITAEESKALSRIEAYELLYLSGLSTKDKADLIAGKGVGMDVVRTNVSEIRGTITTDSNQGKGTSFTIRLPLTLSICKALCCVSDQARIAFPMDGVEDALNVPKDRVQVNAEGERYIQWRDMQLTFKPLNELLAYNRQIGRGKVYGANKDEDSVAIVVLRSAGNILAIQVDQVVNEQEIVIKQLEGPMPKPIGIAGATVMGDGRIMPIGDVLELIDIAMGRVGKDRRAMLWEQNNLAAALEVPVTEPRVLIVDDSITVRELLSMTFNKAGYRVEQARDGQEAWDKLKSGLPCDIVFCDIEMPRMDGLELLSRLHKDPDLTDLPVAMLTSRGAEKHRQMAFDLGASGYFTKPYLEEALLDAASRMLKGEKLVTSNVSASSASS